MPFEVEFASIVPLHEKAIFHQLSWRAAETSRVRSNFYLRHGDDYYQLSEGLAEASFRFADHLRSVLVGPQQHEGDVIMLRRVANKAIEIQHDGVQQHRWAARQVGVQHR